MRPHACAARAPPEGGAAASAVLGDCVAVAAGAAGWLLSRTGSDVQFPQAPTARVRRQANYGASREHRARREYGKWALVNDPWVG